MFSRLLPRRLMVVAVSLFVVATLAIGLVQAQEVTSIRFGTLTGWAVDGVNALLVDAFKEAHPDVEVEIEYYTDIATQITSQAAAHTMPDVVFTADLFVVPFVQNGITLDMQQFAETDEDINIDDVYPIMLDLGRVEGDSGLYMIPSSYDIVTLVYNKSMFEAAGAPLPTADSTWDEIIESCKMIREQTENYCIPAGPGWAPWWATYVPWIVGYGGSLLGEDGRTVMLSSPESLAGITAYTDMWTVHDVAQPLDFDAGGACFVVGKCALTFEIAGSMDNFRKAELPFEWDVEVIPTSPEGKVTGMGTYGFAISADAQDPELAWDFVKNMLTPDIQKAISLNYTGTPLLMSLADDPEIVNRAGPPDNIGAFVTNGANGILPTYFPGECGSLYAGQINALMTEAFTAVINGDQTVEEAFTFANDEIQACLDETIPQ